MAKSSRATTAAPEQPKTQRRGPSAKQKVEISVSSADILTNVASSAGSDIVSPMDLINKAAAPSTPTHLVRDPWDEINEIEEEDTTVLDQPARRGERLSTDLGPGVTTQKTPHRKVEDKDLIADEEQFIAGQHRKNLAPELPAEPDPAVPAVRKVVIKKITRYAFRLGMEKVTNEQLNLVPGVGHTFVCDMVGNEYLTGFDGGKYEKDKKRLEGILRVSLAPNSPFWGTLKFRMEDKPHGQILNFDDKMSGAYNEVVYFGMLGSSIIANGLQEHRNGTKPMAEWFIEDKEAEAEHLLKQMNDQQEASNVFQTISNVKKRNIAKLLPPTEGLVLQPWGSSDNVVNMDLWKYITKNAENATMFVTLARKHDTEIVVRAMTADAIKLNVVRKNGAGEYKIGDVILGVDIDTIAAKLALPQYADVREAVQNQIKLKNR